VVVNGDTKFEPDEAFFANLSGATNGAVIGDGTGVGTILNNEPTPITIESFGVTRLVEVGNQFFLRDSGDAGPSVKFQGTPFTEGRFGAWTAIGAEQVAGGYQVALKFGAADQYTAWNLDGNGNFVSSALGAVPARTWTCRSWRRRSTRT